MKVFKYFQSWKLKVAAAVILTLPALFVFTNMTPLDVSNLSTAGKLQVFQTSSQKFHNLIHNGGFSDAGKRAIREQKFVVDRVISGLMLAANCSEIMYYVPTMQMGIYTVYPGRNAAAATEVFCVVGGGMTLDVSAANLKAIHDAGLLGKIIYLSPAVFDWKVYTQIQPDLRKLNYSESQAQYHWLKHGIGENRRGNLTFYAQEYAILNYDLYKAYDINYEAYLWHFLNWGVHEGRSSSFFYDATYYKASNLDLIKAYANNWASYYAHFVNYGIREGRKGSNYFDPVFYLSKYSDLKTAFGSDHYGAMTHWFAFGIWEGRQASPIFDAAGYLNKYGDLRNAYGSTNYYSALTHYIQYGKIEGRSSSQGPCKITQAICPNAPTYVGTFLDDVNGSGTNLTVCSERASQWYNWCGGGPKMKTNTTTAAFYSDDKVIDQKIVRSSCEITLTACPNYPSTVGTFLDSYGLANTDQNTCMNRASDYYNWCGGASKMKGEVAKSSYYVSGNIVQSAHVEQAFSNGYTSPAVFDWKFYVSVHPDLSSMNESQAQTHWLTYGINEGRRGNAIFSVSEYLAFNPDLKSLSKKDLVGHYLLNGIHEGRRASLFFDPIQYKMTNPDVARAYPTSWSLIAQHYVYNGVNEGRIPTQYFNPKYYRTTYSDMGSIYKNDAKGALIHFIKHGIGEGRQAAPGFNSVSYFNKNSDLKRAYGSTSYYWAYFHYIITGQKEGRRY